MELDAQIERTVSELVGEGVHTALRKFCDSREAQQAWWAIRHMPDKEWGIVCDVTASVIVQYIAKECHIVVAPLKT